MSTSLMTRSVDEVGAMMEKVMIEGDLAPLTPAERLDYYAKVCESTGLNPLLKPFAYLRLNGKLVLYALKACTDQLRQVHNISTEIVSQGIHDGVLTVHVRAWTPTGRKDEDVGSVSVGDAKGEVLANMRMKAVTKAKRRVTLSICGLGMLDESEVESIPGAQPVDITPKTAAAPMPPRMGSTGSTPMPPKMAEASAPMPPTMAEAQKPHEPELSREERFLRTLDETLSKVPVGDTALLQKVWDRNERTIETQLPDQFKARAFALWDKHAARVKPTQEAAE